MGFVLLLKLLDQHPGWAMSLTLVGLYALVILTWTFWEVQTIRKRVDLSVTAAECEGRHAGLKDIVLTQAQAVVEKYPTKEEALALIRTELGKGNGGGI